MFKKKRIQKFKFKWNERFENIKNLDCPIAECNSLNFKTIRSLKDHWQKYHSHLAKNISFDQYSYISKFGK